MSRLYNILSEIAARVGVDYIVEQSFGSDGAWSYIKWNSGKLECFRRFNPGAYTINTQRGSMYSGGDMTQTYPVAFTEIPTVTSSVSLGTSAFVIDTQLTGSTTTNSTIRLVAASSMAQNNGYIVSVYAVGRWK